MKTKTERVGFEPTVAGYATQHFQCCAFDHSATSPEALYPRTEASEDSAGAACSCLQPKYLNRRSGRK